MPLQLLSMPSSHASAVPGLTAGSLSLQSPPLTVKPSLSLSTSPPPSSAMSSSVRFLGPQPIASTRNSNAVSPNPRVIMGRRYHRRARARTKVSLTTAVRSAVCQPDRRCPGGAVATRGCAAARGLKCGCGMRSVIAMAASCVLILAVARTAAGETKTETVAAPADPDAAMYACGKPRGPFALSLKPEVELKELVTWAMGISCKQIFYNSALASWSAKITMLTPGTLAFSEAWALFQHALRAMGLAVVKKGKGLEIVESLAARDEALAIRRTFPDEGTELVRLLLRPEHVAVEDLKAALELVKSKNGVVAPLEKLRAVLVTDDAAHVARMRPLVEELDRPAAGDGVYAIPLDHVDAAGMVETLNDLLAPSAGAAAATGPAAASAAGSG